METRKVINFRVPAEIHRKLKTVAVSQGTTITKLLNGFIKEKIDSLDREALAGQLRNIPQEERLDLIHEIEEEERQMSKT